MSDVKVCIYAICKNEEAHVDRWMGFAREADYIYVVDTGSTDNTMDKLEDHANEGMDNRFGYSQHLFGKFRFDVARNLAIERAEEAFPDADVFITVDFDEYIKPGWADVIRRNWAPGCHERISYLHKPEGSNGADHRNWGHARGWRWKYPCHEVMIRGYDGDIWYQAEETCSLTEDCGYGSLCVIHDKDESKDRSFYLDLLKLRLDEYRDESSLAYYMRELSYIADWAGILRAKDEHQQLYHDSQSSERMMIHLCVAKARAYDYVNCPFEEGDAAFKSVEHETWNYRRPYLDHAVWLINSNNPRRPELKLRAKMALQVLEEGIDRSVNIGGLFEDDGDLWTWRYLDWMSVAAYYADEPCAAVRYADMALHEDPSNHHVMNNLMTARRLMDDHKADLRSLIHNVV